MECVSVLLQVVGTVMVTLFSFYGLKIKTDATVFTEGTPKSNISVDEQWLKIARIGLVLLVLGMLSSLI